MHFVTEGRRNYVGHKARVQFSSVQPRVVHIYIYVISTRLFLYYPKHHVYTGLFIESVFIRVHICVVTSVCSRIYCFIYGNSVFCVFTSVCSRIYRFTDKIVCSVCLFSLFYFSKGHNYSVVPILPKASVYRFYLFRIV